MCLLFCCLDFMCVLMTLCMVTLYWDYVILCIMEAIRSLSRWFCWVDGPQMWFLMRYILLRLLVNRYMYFMGGNLGIG